jgi:hypothetical protein
MKADNLHLVGTDVNLGRVLKKKKKKRIGFPFSECCTKVDNPPLATTTTTTTTAVRATKEQIASAKTATNSTQVSSRPSTRSNSQPSESSEAPYTPEQRRKTDRGRGRGGKSSQ